MKTLIDELIQMTEKIGGIAKLPTIEQIILPPKVAASQSKYSKFGLMILEDRSAGFFYRLLDQPDWERLYSDNDIEEKLRALSGSDPTALAAGLRSSDPLSRGLGMAAINAISQYAFRQSGFEPAEIARQSTTAHKDVARVGMVGFFRPMIETLQKANTSITVIELDEALYQNSESLLVTGDSSQLQHCDLVYCTASTLLNNTLETLLQQLPHRPRFELIGPTCGCFADPFFKRGVDKIGGSIVVDTDKAVSHIQSFEPWGDSVRKYEIDAGSYPGFDFFLERLSAGSV